MTAERAAALADSFAQANQAAMEFARSCSEEQWQTVVPGEGWTVGVVLHHIAEGHATGLRWLEAMSRGEAVTDTTGDIDEWNVEHAGRSAGVGIDQTIDLLRENGARTEAAFRRLSDEELDRTAPFGPADGMTLPTDGMATALAGHAREHLAHAQEAVGLSPSSGTG
jgi:uncharacterized damage-inducible protein DinB